MCARLEQSGLRCWVAPRDIPPGTAYGAAILDGINEATVMVVILSHQSNISTYVSKEVERAIAKGVSVIPFRIEDILPAKELEFFLSAEHWLDAINPPMEQHLQILAESVHRLLGTRRCGVHANKRINNIMNAEQGIVGWDWDETGYEYREFDVIFQRVFRTPPIVNASVQMLDSWSEKDTCARYWISVDAVDCGKAKIKVGTWNGNKIAGCKIAWLALGE